MPGFSASITLLVAFISTASAGAVIDGAHSITLTNSTLTGKLYGVKILRSTPGAGTATITVNGGSVTSTAGDLFYVTAAPGLTATAAILVKGEASLTAVTGNLLNADSASTVTFTADTETLTGNILSDATSTVATTLQNGSSLTGTITHAALTLDAASTWCVTGNSTLTVLTDPAGISDAYISNIDGGGYTVTYNAALPANAALKSRTYHLAGGGILTPAPSTIN